MKRACPRYGRTVWAGARDGRGGPRVARPRVGAARRVPHHMVTRRRRRTSEVENSYTSADARTRYAIHEARSGTLNAKCVGHFFWCLCCWLDILLPGSCCSTATDRCGPCRWCYGARDLARSCPPVPLSLVRLRADVEDPVGVDLEAHLDLRHAARRRRDAAELELAQQVVSRWQSLVIHMVRSPARPVGREMAWSNAGPGRRTSEIENIDRVRDSV